MVTAATGPRMMIRAARTGDVGALREIFNEGIQDGLATFETEPISLEDQRRRITDAAADPRHPILVAELRGWPLGWITIQAQDLHQPFDDLGEVTLYVRREFRSFGVGKQLMRAAYEEAQKQGYRKIFGYVLAEHRGGLLLCRAAGWREVGRLEKHVRHGAGLRDVVLVERLIAPPE